MHFHRRQLLAAALTSASAFLSKNALGQITPQQTSPHFSFENVVRRAMDIAAVPFSPSQTTLPEPIVRLDFDAWRDIRFLSEKAFLTSPTSKFRLEPFHLGHLFLQPVTINIIRDGLATPIAYSNNLFDYGRTKIEKPLPVNLGFAGFRLSYPINQPNHFDEMAAFLGASYFRFLGRGQRYGLSCRGLAVNAGTKDEEFPYFREFWIEEPAANSDTISLFALLDGESVTGAYHFIFFPQENTRLEVSATLFARRPAIKIGMAPLTSMFFSDGNRQIARDYRPELHDSDGLSMNMGTGEWVWRPLQNPSQPVLSAFMDRDIRGFGLMQRDREFERYQDLDLAYELRPSYWVEPRESFGEGKVELFELPTTDETNDNIVASFVPLTMPEPGKAFSYTYRITSYLQTPALPLGGRVVNTYRTEPRALGSKDPILTNACRFIIDFSGGELPYYLSAPQNVMVVPSSSNGRILRSFVVPNSHINGFRATLDVEVDKDRVTDLRAFLKAGERALSETWTFPWKAPL